MHRNSLWLGADKYQNLPTDERLIRFAPAGRQRYLVSTYYAFADTSDMQFAARHTASQPAGHLER